MGQADARGDVPRATRAWFDVAGYAASTESNDCCDFVKMWLTADWTTVTVVYLENHRLRA